MSRVQERPSRKPGTLQYLDKPWLKGTSLYFVEYSLLLLLLTVVFWLFDALVFGIFGYIADSGLESLRQPAGTSTVAATLVTVPAMLVLWRRVRMEEARRPQLWLRKAHRFPLYGFVFLQALSAIIISYMIIHGLVEAIVAGFDGFAEALLTAIIPGFFALAAHLIASYIFLGRTPREERSFTLVLSGVMLVSALVLLIVLSINYDRLEVKQSPTLLEPDQPLLQEQFRDDILRNRNLFEY
jgi:hypothetical protein